MKKFKVDIKDGMIVGCENFGIWLIEGGKRRHVPDVVTQIKMAIPMDRVIMLPTNEFKAIPEGEPMPKIPLRKGRGRKAIMK